MSKQMKGLQTKQAWIERMTALGACQEVMDWVRSLPDDITGEEIWNSIPAKHYNWLYWFAWRNQSKEVYELFVKAEVVGSVAASDASVARNTAFEALEAARVVALAADVAREAVYCAKFRELFPFSKMEWYSEKTDA